MKHILLISQYFYPEPFRVNDMATEWVKRGYKVTVLTGIPNYPEGKFYKGYDRTHRTREEWNGVNIIRIPLMARGNSSNKLLNAIGMALNYFSFVKSGRKWVKSDEAAKLNADLVFTFEVSPMTQALIGIWYGKRYNVPTFLYVQDLWPENVEAVTGIHSKLVIWPIEKMVDKIYRETTEIFTTSPSFVDSIVNRKRTVNRNKVHYWPQYAEEFYLPMEPQNIKEVEDDGYYKIAFTGNIGTAQGLDILPKTAKLLKKEKVKFIIVGDGRYKSEFERQIEEYNVQDKFVLIPRVPAERIPEILSTVDAGFISFSNTPLWQKTIPAKLQSYMACGKVIIAAASGETKRVIKEADCGICTDIGDARSLAAGIIKLMKSDGKNLGENARAYFEKEFDKKKLMDKMSRYFAKNESNETKNERYPVRNKDNMIKYYWSKIIKKLPGSSVRNVSFEKPSRCEARCTILNSSFGKYSYCGYNCTIINCKIGRFTSIADNVTVGVAHHPIEWTSMSPAFYYGNDNLPKKLKKLNYCSDSKETVIGNDVWIGEGVFIRDGVTIGDGAVIGARSVVTKDVPPYSIYAGNPAKMIRLRFSERIISELLDIKWWNMDDDKLVKYAKWFSNPEFLIAKLKRRSIERS